MENKEQEDEPEVITFEDIINRHKDMEEEEMHKIVLVCKNCGHQDLLKNFIKKEKREIINKTDDWTIPDQVPTYPKPNLPKTPYYSQNDTTCLVMIRDYEKMFFCPKCGSSLVCLNPKFVKNNTARAL